MKKTIYSEGYTTPELTVLEVEVEHGFEGSTGTTTEGESW